MRALQVASLAGMLWALALCLPAVSAVAAGQEVFPAGSDVEVLWRGTWYPATVKEARPNDRWLIGYRGWSSSWDEEVGADRIRARGTTTPRNAGTRTPTAAPPTAPAADPVAWPVGAEVEVLSSGVWYAATIKEARRDGRWLIGYDGWSSAWDAEVGAERIRAKRAATTSLTPGATARQEATRLAWPAKPVQGSTPLAGAYLQLVMYSYPYVSYNFVSWFFTDNGRFSTDPVGGISLPALSTTPHATSSEGTYWVEGDQLVMEWADGRKPWRLSYRGPEVLPIGAGATRQRAFPRGWRFDGSYEGGATAGGGASSSSNTLTFRRDGTYTRGSIVSLSSTGETTQVSGGAVNASVGTYEFDDYTLTLRENGREVKYTVFAYGSSDAAGRPEQIFWQGGMLKRQER